MPLRAAIETAEATHHFASWQVENRETDSGDPYTEFYFRPPDSHDLTEGDHVTVRMNADGATPTYDGTVQRVGQVDDGLALVIQTDPMTSGE